MDLGYSAIILLAACRLWWARRERRRSAIIIGIVVLIGFVILYMLARYNQWALDVFHKLTARWPSLKRWAATSWSNFCRAGCADGWLAVPALSILDDSQLGRGHRLLLLMVRAFFPQTQLTWAMFGLGAAAFGGAIPSLPGAVGTFEGAFGGAIALLTGDQSTALAVALTGRLYNYINSGVIGGIGLLRDGQTLSGIYGELRKITSGKDTEPTRE